MPKTQHPLRGLANISFYAADLDAAKEWYTELFGVKPYFEVPGYIEFRIGDYQHEFGIIDAAYAPKAMAPGPGGSVTYWHVDDVDAAFARLLAHGGKEYEPVTKRGEGFVTASVIDPFGNILGVMYNAHYLAVLAAKKA
ncbi:VOC family protein [Chitinophaga barathri]|uniref:VOC family protein n=1 Tax=Chitinophaga barathri TaxID=1647451 RepID=A0A3N4MEB9_9BACT|nr:VOC family protein [Chitinophaga barathri]RPD41705.1 VOC family protein [Chitinophaga barathri]